MRGDDGSAGSAARLCLASRRPLAASFAVLPVGLCPSMLTEDPHAAFNGAVRGAFRQQAARPLRRSATARVPSHKAN
jgi:hypothetical protein